MALDFNMTRLLLREWSISRTDFGKTATLGRQGLHVSKRRLQYNLNEFGLKNINANDILKRKDGYFEPFLELLGATATDSIDVSTYEGANTIIDMNQPLPDNQKKRYDTLIESGSLEHIFNFPTAIKNCMELVKLNGRFILFTPCNNFFGHGFYQFSPELFFRIFSSDNGFKVETMIFFEDEYVAKWKYVKDPMEVRQRVELVNAQPSYLFIVAKKTEDKQIFSIFPNQSDYQFISWNSKMPTPYELMNLENKRKSIKKIIPEPLKKLGSKLIITWKKFKLIFNKGTNPKFFTQAD
jgi:hypothetical protein